MRESVDREPCPFRIVDDAGGAFAFGLVGGAIWNFVAGARNAPRGYRMEQAIARMRARTPILGGSFAVWGTLFSCFDCSFTYIRKKEDPWNAIMSGAATGGLLALRAGLRAAGQNAVVGGVLLAAIEGLNILVSRALMPYFEKQQSEAGQPIDMLEPPVDPLRPALRRTEPLFRPAPSSSSIGGSIYGALSLPGASSGTPFGSSSGGGSSSGTGFDLDTLPDFDTSTQTEQGKWSRTQADSPSEKEKEAKPFWKVW